jgi:surface protein
MENKNIEIISFDKNWDVSHISSFTSLFSGASSFNQNLSHWNTSNVTSLSNTLTTKNDEN